MHECAGVVDKVPKIRSALHMHSDNMHGGIIQQPSLHM